MSNNWYYYLHQNGDLIGKNPIVVYSDRHYFDSPFVKKVWLVDTENRSNAWNLAVEALALGARIDRVKELADRWNLTKEDLIEYIMRNPEPTDAQKEGMDLFIREILKLEPNAFWDDLIAANASKSSLKRKF